MNESKEINNNNSVKKRNLKIRDSHEFAPPYINPLVRFVIYSYIVLLTGNVFMGWTGIQEMLYKAGSFEGLCDAQSSQIIFIRSNRIIDCPARKAAINEMYTIAFSVNFILSIFTGTVLKVFGHKITFLLGHFINFSCWIFMGFFPRNGLLLRLIMLTIGLTSEAMYLPLTTVSLYFPEDKSLILSILGSIRTLSFFMPTILSYIYLSPRVKKEKFYLVTILFGFVAYFCSFMIGLFIIPWNFFKKRRTINPSTNNGNSLNISSLIKNGSDNGILNKSGININNTKTSNDIKHTNASNSNNSTEVTILKEPLHTQPFFSRFTTVIEEVKSLIRSPDIFQTVLFTIASSLHISSVEFINKAQRELLTTTSGQSVIGIFKYVQVLTFFPGLFIGHIADKYGTPETMTVLQIFLLITYLLLTANNYDYMMVGCLFYIIGGSMYLSIVYFYVYENFAPEKVGVSLGFILIFCGAAILCNIPLYKHALKMYKNGLFSNIAWVLSIYMLISLLSNIGVILLRRHDKNKRSKNNQISNVM